MKNIREYKRNGVQYSFILDCIEDPDGVGEMTDLEKIQFFFSRYNDEFNNEYNERQYPNEAERIGEYLRGLPSCCSVPFWNDEIIKIGKAWGYCKTARQEDNFLSNYWTVCGVRLLQIRDYFEGNAIQTIFGEKIYITPSTYFVTMTDKCLSEWGKAEGKTHKQIIVCDNFRQAEIILDGIENCKDRNGNRYINICTELPSYDPRKYTVSIRQYKDCPLYIDASYIK